MPYHLSVVSPSLFLDSLFKQKTKCETEWSIIGIVQIHFLIFKVKYTKHAQNISMDTACTIR